MSLVYNRTRTSEDDKPLRFLDVIPPGLVTKFDRISEKRAMNAGKVRIGVLEMAGLMGVEVPQPEFDELYPDEAAADNQVGG